ncbi:hypothetical protein [uncultured Alistipes sp.]|uniref:hypothetical protein n=1 Tax=uncultured Alistipes sp. TaxID=538949 RepID=UPI0027298B3E|nr:hypothetical protein [uncultured Alistipes sp.]
MAEVGTRGLVYASSSYAAGNHNAGFLDFNASNVYPLNNANRAAALSVRCVQHLHGCFQGEKSNVKAADTAKTSAYLQIFPVYSLCRLTAHLRRFPEGGLLQAAFRIDRPHLKPGAIFLVYVKKFVYL